MDSSAFLRGVVIGFSIAAPVGPIGILCIRRTLADGRLAGFISGIGAATADAIYGSLAAFGLTVISLLLIQQSAWLRLIGGGFLIFLGIRTFLAQPSHTTEASPTPGQSRLAGYFFSTLLLTLTNPLTILSFAAIFAGLGIGSTAVGDYWQAAVLVLGVFLGSACWWLLLSSLVGLFQSRLNQRLLTWVNRISGAIITGFGAVALISLIG
jgi:threonine/homoserine/homoserine lactone efflux protein